MKATRTGIARGIVLATGLARLIVGAEASAQSANLTWVAGSGDDGGPCTLRAPCRTFAKAIEKTAAGGEIRCLAQGEFGAVAINKALAINCSSIGTGTIVSSTGGVTVQAGPGDVVVIDGLDINCVAIEDGANNGIAFTSGGALIVRNTTIRNCVYNGIGFQPSAEATLTVDNVAITDAGLRGVSIVPTGRASARATIVRSQISNSGVGVGALGYNTTGSIFVSLRSTTVTNSRSYGVYADNITGQAASATIAIDESTISGGADLGLVANGTSAGMLVNNSTIANNKGGGIATYGDGVIYSYGNNRVNGNNKKDGNFTGTIAQR